MHQALFCMLKIQHEAKKIKSQISWRLYCSGSMQDVIQLPVSNSFYPNTTSSPSFCVVLAPSSQLTPTLRDHPQLRGTASPRKSQCPLPPSTANDRVQGPALCLQVQFKDQKMLSQG